MRDVTASPGRRLARCDVANHAPGAAAARFRPEPKIQLPGFMPAEETKTTLRPTGAAAETHSSAAAFVTKFTSHHRRCMSLAKRFTADDPELQDSAAISQLYRASQEMLEQAKEARALTEIYLALDETHRDAVRPIITARFKDIANLARASWRRFCDSMELVRTSKPEIAIAQREFEPHADQFQQALRAFIEMSAATVS